MAKAKAPKKWELELIHRITNGGKKTDLPEFVAKWAEEYYNPRFSGKMTTVFIGILSGQYKASGPVEKDQSELLKRLWAMHQEMLRAGPHALDKSILDGLIKDISKRLKKAGVKFEVESGISRKGPYARIRVDRVGVVAFSAHHPGIAEVTYDGNHQINSHERTEWDINKRGFAGRITKALAARADEVKRLFSS